MDIDIEEITVDDNEARNQYEFRYDGSLALLSYAKLPGRIVLEHTEVPPALEGRGIAGRLAHHALEDARAKGLRVVPTCPYVRSYLTKHPEYSDLAEVRTGPDGSGRKGMGR